MQLWQQGSICEPVDKLMARKLTCLYLTQWYFLFLQPVGQAEVWLCRVPHGEKSCKWANMCWLMGSIKSHFFPSFLASQSLLCHMPWQNAVSCVKVEQLFYTYIHLQGLLESLEVFSRLWGSNWYLTEELQLANAVLGRSIYLNLLDACQELTALWGLATAPKLSPREFIRISLLCVCKFIFCFGLSIHTDIILDFL